MTTDEATATPDRKVLIELLDPTCERPVKTWTFEDRLLITIGRADDQDVEVSDGYVSRSHAQLVLREGEWRLVSLGRNGVVCENKLVSDYLLKNGEKFRLGSNGPCLRFRTSGKTESMHTVCFESLPAPLFQIDETKVQEEVGQIAEGEYFQSLQDKARKLRKQRSAT